MTVSLVKFDDSLDSLRKAVELCDGFEKLNSNDKILIKPNNCFRHKIMPKISLSVKVPSSVYSTNLSHIRNEVLRVQALTGWLKNMELN